MQVSEQWSFVLATRFWAMVILAIGVYLQNKGFIGQPEAILIATIAGGFIGIKTLDRLGDNLK